MIRSCWATLSVNSACVDRLLRLVVGDQVLRAVQRLRRRDRGTGEAEVPRDVDLWIALDRRIVVVVVGVGRERGGRQQAGPRLRQLLLRRIVLGLRRGDRRIVLLRLAVDLHQVLAGRGSREGGQTERKGHGEGKQASFHRRHSILVRGVRAFIASGRFALPKRQYRFIAGSTSTAHASTPPCRL